MKTRVFLFLLLTICVVFCFSAFTDESVNQSESNTIKTRFQVPSGFMRTDEAANSFGLHLRNLPLKPLGSKVKYYDGTFKNKNNVYAAVIDLPIGTKDLHQCADAVMRLRADYLYQKKAFDQIHFNFTNGFRVDYSRWKNGDRIVIKGNKTSWVKSAKPFESYNTYWKYMETIFQYAGTASLSRELQAVPMYDMKIGDVFIKGGFPGHAVIVVDMAVHPKTKKRLFLLAQSYMPAQDLQVLKNPNNEDLSPWYEVNLNTTLETPEWTFQTSELKRF